MILTIKRKIISIIEYSHLRIFGHRMSDEMRSFLGYLSWSMIGGIGASILLLIVNVAAGRYLGLEAYGKYNGIISIASVLSIFFLLSFDTSSIRYLADKKYSKNSKEIFTTVFVTVLIIGISISIFLVNLPEHVLNRYIDSKTNLYWIITIAFVFSFKNLFNAFLRAFHRIKKQSLIRLIDAFLVFLVFSYLVIYKGEASHISYMQAVIIGGGTFVLIAIYSLKKYFYKFSRILLLKIFHEYNKFFLIGSMVGILMVGDKYIIGRLLGVKELGYFSAYYTASHVIVAELGGIFMNAFWPSVIKNAESLKEVIKKIDKLFLIASPIWISLIMISTVMFIALFGKEFPLRWDYVVLFSTNTFMGFLFSMMMSFLNIDHIKKAVLISSFFVIISIATLILTKNIIAYISIQVLIQAFMIYKSRGFLLRYDKNEK